MKIAIINMTHSGSTGTIMLQIAASARKQGHQVKTFSAVPYRRGRKIALPAIEGHQYWGTRAEAMGHYYLGSLLGINGCLSRKGTKGLIRELEAFGPDVIHLHNLHSFCIHMPLLFSYIKKRNVRLIWTLHDCWAFTGHCPHFVIAGCEKWKRSCGACPQLRVYPKTYLDTTERMHRAKQGWYAGVRDMTLVTPSRWLAELVGRSFLKDRPVERIPNGIDLDVFKPTQSDFRKRYGCQDKFLLLGVASDWGKRKGLDVFLWLAERLDERYRICLVGTDEGLDRQLPDSIISIHRTQSATELAQIYSAADLFVNPTREDTYPTVNMEALACGTPVLTFRTGGSPEIPDASCGCAVDCDDIDALELQIHRIRAERPYRREDCLIRAKGFDLNEQHRRYLELYLR